MPAFRVNIPAELDFQFDLTPELAQHLKVLRIKNGGTFDVLLPDGRSAVAVLQKSGRTFSATLTRILESDGTDQLPVEIALALIRWPRLEWFVEKATELGVQKLTLLQTEYSRFRGAEEISSHKMARLRKISDESLKQCHRNTGPSIADPIDLKSFLKKLSPETVTQKILLNEKISEPLLSPSTLPKRESYLFLIGPEGGLAENEIKDIEKAGFLSYSIGKTAIRTETAALYCISAVKFLGM